MEINIEDRFHDLDRSNRFAKLSQSGPQIQIENLGQKCSNKKFLVEFKQTKYVEEDKSKDCTNYPNSNHSSYNECDQAYVRQKISAYIGPNFTPLWAATNGSKATEKLFSRLKR